MKLCHAILLFAITPGLSGSAAFGADDDKQKKLSKPAADEPLITQVYSLQELDAPTVDFALSSSTYKAAFVSPGGSSWQTFVSTGGTALGQGGSSSDTKAPAKSSPTDDITKMIEDFVEPDSWMDNGGMVGRIREINGTLVIRQTQANHAKIAKLLSDVLSEQRGMVRVSADWLLLSPADAAKLNKPASGAAEEAITTIDPALLTTPPAGAKHFSAETVSRSGQTVYVLSGTDRALVSSSTPVVSTGVGAYSTDISHVGSGLALELNSRVNWEQKTALVTVGCTFSNPIEVAHDIVAFDMPTSQPGAMMIAPPTSGFHPFSRAVQDLRTTIRLPLGKPVIAGSMTLKPDTKGDDEQVLVLVLKVNATR